MGILSDFFIADGSTVPTYDGIVGIDVADKCPLRDLTPLQGAQFLAVLRRSNYTFELINEFQLLSPEDGEQWTMSVPQDMVDELAKFEQDQVPVLAEQFAEATSEELGWSRDDFVPVVKQLTDLARRAKSSGKSMYLWNSL